MDRRVVITGVGVVTPVGTGVPKFWEAIVAGKSGIGLVTAFDTTGYPTQIAGEALDFDPTATIPPKEIRRMDRFAQMAITASLEAVADSGIDIGSAADRVGVIYGAGIGGIRTIEEQAGVLKDRGSDRVSPFMIPMLIADMGAGLISMRLGAKGPNYAVVSACATGIHALSDAAHTIARGDADAIITGGAEAAVTGLGMSGFCSMRAMSTRNDDPQGASRPFDLGRDGFVMGEGAGALLLESLDQAERRGADIYGEVIGTAASGDAHHMSAPAPGGEGAARSMKAAVERAEINPEDVDYINTHGTSTPLGDVAEVQAIKTVFGDSAKSLATNSTKSMTGHLLGAAGAVESIVCLLAIRDGVLPPTINQDDPDTECDLDTVPNVARQATIKTALNNGFGFGGHNATVIFRRFDG